MDEQVIQFIAAVKQRNISAVYVETLSQARELMFSMIPGEATVGFSGSVTLQEMGIVAALEARGTAVYNPYAPHLSRPESLVVRRQGAQAGYFLASANAIAQTGELVFFSAFGNRTAGVAYANRVIIACGRNKIVPTREAALARAREVATPQNVRRLGWQTPCAGDSVCRSEQCVYPDVKRMCGQILVIEGEVDPERIRVIIIGEKAGF